MANTTRSQNRPSKLRPKPTWDDSIHDLPAMYHIPAYLQQCKKDAKSMKYPNLVQDSVKETKWKPPSDSISISNATCRNKGNFSNESKTKMSKSSIDLTRISEDILASIESFKAKMDYFAECIDHNMDDDRSFRIQVLGAFENLRIQNQETSRLVEKIVADHSALQSKVSQTNGEIKSLQNQVTDLSEQIRHLFTQRPSSVARDVNVANSETSQQSVSDIYGKKSVHNIHIPTVKENVLPIRYELITDENSVQPIRAYIRDDSVNNMKYLSRRQ